MGYAASGSPVGAGGDDANRRRDALHPSELQHFQTLIPAALVFAIYGAPNEGYPVTYTSLWIRSLDDWVSPPTAGK